ncbi:MAG: 16S rRNA (guanine(966)-N(2))-methyltransferase RsmD [Notoacmeibacter sp.]
MRIVGGTFRGRALATPQSQDIRPTTDRARQALFNILTSQLGHDWSSIRALDMFAGTGAFGLEALSRGASHALFVETSVEGRGLIRDNIESFGLTGIARLLRRDATDMGPVGTMDPFTLAFADPPYGKGLGEAAYASAATGGWLANGALCILEEAASSPFLLPQCFALEDERRYGETCLRLMRFERQ